MGEIFQGKGHDDFLLVFFKDGEEGQPVDVFHRRTTRPLAVSAEVYSKELARGPTARGSQGTSVLVMSPAKGAICRLGNSRQMRGFDERWQSGNLVFSNSAFYYPGGLMWLMLFIYQQWRVYVFFV